MNDIFYLFTIIFLTIFMLFYGGHNFQNSVVYNSSYFNIFNKTNLLTEKIIDNLKKFDKINTNQNFIFKISDQKFSNIIPNCTHTFIINVKPSSFINVNEIIKKSNINKKNHLMIVFDFLKNNNILIPLELFIKTDISNIHNDQYIQSFKDQQKYYGIFLPLKNPNTITDIYDIYNPNNKNIFFALLIIKKPFWFY